MKNKLSNSKKITSIALIMLLSVFGIGAALSTMSEYSVAEVTSTSGDVTLTSLEIKNKGVKLLTDFYPSVGEYTIILEEAPEISVSAVPADSKSQVSISLNGGSWVSNHSLVALQQGENTLIVKVTTGLSSKNYTINITAPIAPEVEEHFTWDNVLAYFVLTDRFYNGDTSNDNSYYRNKDIGGGVATFHGGDIKGLTAKLDYLEDLGVNAIWITAPYEQIHGWVSGKDDKFPHYAFHGYYAQDWTYMDKNMGTIEEFRTFVDDAHSRGIRIIMDIVLNHTGYNTIEDMITYDFGSTTVTQHGWTGNGNWSYNHDVTDYNSSNWGNWWGGWARGFEGRFGFGTPGGDDYTQCLANLPDVMTEKTSSIAIPAFLKKKWQMETGSEWTPWMLPAASGLRSDNQGAPADYVIKWLAAWVREFGIDGFRCDTAKHVEYWRWKQLKDAAVAALKEWRADQNKSNDSDAKEWADDFWMTGEAWGHGLDLGSAYFTQGSFDSMINFSFNGSQGGTGRTPTTSDWSSYANTINNSSNNVLSYLSSHDTGLHRSGDMKNTGTMFLLLPGGVQIYYGDETERPKAYTGCGDTDMMTRGDMNWDAVDGDVNKHWKTVGKFRKRNPAVGAGKQTDLGSNTYGRKYTKGDYSNNVVIKLSTTSGTSYDINVSGFFEDGTKVQDGYNTEVTGTVANGKVSLKASGSVILVEKQVSVVPPIPIPSAPVVTASPSSQTFTESVTVTLSSNPSTTIYYTTDGTTPSAYSTQYVSALTFTESTTLKTFVTLDGKSDIKIFTYTKKGDTPQIEGKSLETAYYSTNPNEGVGKYVSNMTISVNGNGVSSTALTNWTSDMLIAQGAARDICQAFLGGHEYPLYDSYALYGAWDDNYLYLGWQFVNVINEGVGNEAKPYNADIRQMIALDLNPDLNCEGVLEDGSTTIWDATGTKLNTFNNGMDAAIMFSSKPTNGTPAIFLPTASGLFSYDEPYCVGLKINGTYGYADGLLPSITSIWGINQYGYDPELLKGETGFTDLMPSHTKSNDTFYEMKIKLSDLGITREHIEGTGIGVMHISTYGAGAIGSLPFDDTVYDNVLETYSQDPSSSKEKEDLDVFTYNMARIGKLSSGGVTPTPTKPVVSSSKADGTTFDGDNLSLTLSVTGKDLSVAKYTTNGIAASETNGTDFTNGQIIVVPTTAIADGEYLTLSLYAKNTAGEVNKTYNYLRQKVVEPENYIIYFKPASGWSTPSAYAYNGDGESAVKLLGEWPGKTMTVASDGWYSVTLPETASSATRIIFYSSATNRYPADSQPGLELNFSGKTGWYDLSSKVWTTENPNGPQKPTVTFSPSGGSVKSNTNIVVTVSSDATSVSGTFGSQSVSLTTGANTFAVNTYLTDGQTAMFTVNATNSVGTTTQSASFKRDDTVVTLSADPNSLRIYQVMVSSFQDGASVGYGTGWGPSHHNGDLRGIINALDYIKGLGMNALWMTPVFDSSGSSSDGKLKSTGYFCKDYFNVDPNFGTNEDLRELITKAHDKGIYVFLDGVFGHHGGDVKASPSGKTPTNGDPLSYPSSLEFYKEVATYWIENYEIDGWRLDQAYQVSNRPVQGQGGNYNYWLDIREAVESVCAQRKSQGKQWGTLGYMVGENWLSAGEINSWGYNAVQGGIALRSNFDFPGRYHLVQTVASEESGAGGYDVSNLNNVFTSGYPSFAYPNMFLTNHDIWRFGNLVKQKYNYGKENDAYWRRHKTAISFLAAFTGPITVYYGDEIGDIVDCWPNSCGGNVYSDNMSRTNGTITGFDSKQQDLHDYVAKLMQIRDENPALWRGNRENKKADSGVYADLKYDTTTGNKVLYVMNNGTNSSTSTSINCGGSGLEDLMTGEVISGSGTYNITIEGLSARFFKVK